jgi:hypothetical protein
VKANPISGKCYKGKINAYWKVKPPERMGNILCTLAFGLPNNLSTSFLTIFSSKIIQLDSLDNTFLKKQVVHFIV